MNEKETMLQSKTVYLCMAAPSERSYMDRETMRSCRHLVAQYEEEYQCRAIAPHTVLPELLNYEDPRELEIAFWFSQKVLSLCDTIVVFGDCLSDRMRVEIDYMRRSSCRC